MSDTYYGLSKMEYNLMKYFWNTNAPVSFSEVEKYCNTELHYGWAQPTLHTYLTRLVKKGILHSEGKGYKCKRSYYPELTEQELAHKYATDFVDNTFNGSISDLLVSLTYNTKLSESDIEELKNYPDEKTVMITTGSQGESMAALSRMAADIHKKVTIMPGDTVILSSNPIPGNEKSVSRVINELSEKGANVIFQDAHVSGHACQEELKLIYSLVKPKYAVPVHGEYRHRKANANLAKSLGIPKENVFMLHSGDVLEVSEQEAKVVDKVHTGEILVDGLGVGDVGNIVLRDRQHLAEDGIMIVVLTLERGSNQLLAGPDIVSRGFVYVRESEDLMEEARQVVTDAVEDCLNHQRNADWSKIKLVIRDTMNEFIWKKTKRRPMILPIIMDV